jgi:hypothetical protein
LEEKFLPMRANRWQGVWVLTDVYHDEGVLVNEFSALNASLVQFAVLTHFEGEARILVRDASLRQWLIDKFRLVEMRKR